MTSRHISDGLLAFTIAIVIVLVSAPIIPTISVNRARIPLEAPLSRPAEGRAVDSDWPVFGRNGRHTFRGIDASNGIGIPSEKWSNDQGVDTLGACIGRFQGNFDGTVPQDRDFLVYGSGSMLRIVDGNDGRTAWEINTDSLDADAGDILVSTPAITDLNDNGRTEVVLVTDDGTVYAVEPVMHYTGTGYVYSAALNESVVLWNHSCPGTVTDSSIVVADIGNSSVPDVIVSSVAAGSAWLNVIDGQSGKEIWSYEMAGTRVSTPAVYPYSASKNRVVATTVSAEQFTQYLNVYMIKGDGVKAWDKSFQLSTTRQVITLVPSPAVGEMDGDTNNGMEIAVLTPYESNTGVVYILGRDGGGILWQTAEGDIAGQFDASPALEDLNEDGNADVIVASWGLAGLNPVTHVYAFSPAGAEQLWEKTLDSSATDITAESTIASPALTDLNKDGTADVVVATSPNVYTIDGSDGTQLWKFNLTVPGILRSSPAVGDVDRDGFVDLFVEGTTISHNIVDLALTSGDIEFVPEDILEGETVTIAATVHNNGQGTGNDIEVQFFDGNFLISSENLDVIEGYDTSEVTTQWIPDTSGNHTVKVVVDPDDEIEEINEGDNEAAVTVYVGSKYVDLAVEAVKFYRADGLECDGDNTHPIATKTTTIRAVVNNSGNKGTSNVLVTFYYDGNNQIGEGVMIPAVAAGSTGRADIEWVGSMGTHVIKAVADETDAINESNEGNNFRTRSMYFKSNDPGDASYIISGLVYMPDSSTLASNARVRATNARTGSYLETTGSEQGSYNLDVKEIPGGYLEEDTVDLFYQKGDLLTSASVIVYSEDGGASVNPVLHERENYTFAMSLTRDQLELEPGEEGSLGIEITNQGNVNNTVLIELDGVPGDWSSRLDPASGITPEIEPGDTYEATLFITPAEDEDAYIEETITVSTRSRHDPDMTASRGLEITVKPKIGLSLRGEDQGPWEVDPYHDEGGSAAVDFSLKNGGNVEETVTLSASSSKKGAGFSFASLNASYTITDSQVTLPAGARAHFRLEVTAGPQVMSSGSSSFTVTVNATVEDYNVSDTGNFKIDILYPDLKIDVTSLIQYPENPMIGLDTTFSFDVKNSGQGHSPACYAYLVQVMDVGGMDVEAILENASVPALAPGERESVTLAWKKVEAGTHQLKLCVGAKSGEVIHESGTDNNCYSMVFDLLPDLSLKDLDVEVRTLKNKFLFDLEVTVVNGGNVAVEETVLAVYYGVGGVERKVESISVPSIDAGGERTISEEFEEIGLDTGDYTVRVKVDPTDSIQEKDKENNDLEFTGTVRSKGEEDGDTEGGGLDDMMVTAGVLVLLVFILILIVAYLRFNKKRRVLERKRRELLRKKLERIRGKGGDEEDGEKGEEEEDYVVVAPLEEEAPKKKKVKKKKR